MTKHTTVTKALDDGRATMIRVDSHGKKPASITVHIMQPAQTEITTAPAASVTIWPRIMTGDAPTDMLAHLIEALRACQSALKFVERTRDETDNHEGGVPHTE